MDILDRSVLAQALHLLVLAEIGPLFYFGACSSTQPLAPTASSVFPALASLALQTHACLVL